MSRHPFPLRSAASLRLGASAAVAVAVAAAVVGVALMGPGASGVPSSPAVGQRQVAPTTAYPAVVGAGGTDAGMVAYATPRGDVMVAKADGTEAVKIGAEAQTNGQGLAPLAWRMPGADAITYVRRDGALVTAPIDGSEPLVHVTDAVVPADVTDEVIGWDVTGTFLLYLAQPVPGRIESRIIDFSATTEGEPAEVRTIGDPINRRVRAQFFSSIDPIIYQDTVDPETGRAYTASILTPAEGSSLSTEHSVDDATFSPDGRFLFAVSKASPLAQQLVRISLRDPLNSDLVFDNERVCKPAVSPDGRLIVFGAGPDCSELWRINTNGTEPTRIAADVLGVSFATGRFTWSLDSKTVSHSLCQGFEGSISCDGNYLDFDVTSGAYTERATAGSVVRESRPLLREFKVGIDITGPIEYTGRMRVGDRSVADVLSISGGSAPSVKAIDALDSARSFELKLVHQYDSEFVAGTVRIIDAGFDETFPFFARLTPYSLGYARLRGVWTRSEQLPMTSGHIVITLER
ncbi:MAG: hypothetical protein GX868_08965 [Actinobacteria bacterium]|nr:hypothetical protein [Actinomycetota bacterium]